MKGKFHLATVRPTIDVLPNIAYDANDILFDWYAFQIPKGGTCLKSITAIHPGTNASAVAGIDISVIFATSVNGAAPPTLGDPDSASTVITGAACKNHIIGRHFFDGSTIENPDSEFVGYSVWSYSGRQGNDLNDPNLILNGDPGFGGDSTHSATTEGYQTIWMAAFTVGTPDFGTNCLLDGAIATGDAGAQTLDVSEDADADDIFAIGDELLACASDGSSVQKIGTITSLTADTITVNAKDIFGTTVWSSGALVDDDEICFRRPITFQFGFEY